jgi:LuxR family maltose regulon positive regulatory protein
MPDAASTAIITGPAGSGKSTLMAQAYSDTPDGVWLSIDPADNDPTRLWSALADAIAVAVPGFGAPFREQLNSPQPPSIDRIVPTAVNQLVEAERPLWVFIDDLHLLTNTECLRSLESLLDLRPPTVAVVIASRVSPPLRMRKQHLGGHLVEIGLQQLAMNPAEAEEMLEAVGVVLDPQHLDRLHERVEGWVAGLRWAALAVQHGGDVDRFITAAADLEGDIAKYLVEEMLDRLPEDQRPFMLQTSVLGHLCGGVCDAIRDCTDSGRRLEDLERSNAMLVATDRGDGWYRYHHLARDVLAARLVREMPDIVPDLHRRASRWLLEHGDAPDAIEHAVAAGDRQHAAEMLCATWWELANQGQVQTAIRILSQFEPSELRAFQPLAAAAAFIYGLAGDDTRSRSYYEVALHGKFVGDPPDGSASMESALAILRAALVFDGVDQALHDAERAHALEPADSAWRPFTALLVGLGRTWSGNPNGALPFFEEVTTAGAADEAIIVYALAEIALIHLSSGNEADARSTAEIACNRASDAGLEALFLSATAHAAAALSHLALGDPHTASDHLEAARLPMSGVAQAMPIDAMRARLLLADTALRLGCLDVAESYVEGACDTDNKIGDTGVLGDQLAELRNRLEHAQAQSSHGVDLTSREREVLELLATRRTSREIGEELFVSRNTVRTYQQRLYKKLRVNSREDAVIAARLAGALDERQLNT